MKKEDAAAFMLLWITENTPLAIQFLYALVPVLALLLAAFVIYAVFWKGKGGPK
ncbi:hypothetical protein J2X19_005151 [Rhodoferax ferrireducens]|uniref:Transmembrane protein n=1 Tax=Rhodoferax ferrireducens TaxID=192843 RepID=A0ABU2CGH6_9BURK|nr:hypothetical protein [Rhodoferax ferrireducens]MDR7380444.1 hypothetical protein [Rhodoferax ferrireducens]